MGQPPFLIARLGVQYAMHNTMHGMVINVIIITTIHPWQGVHAWHDHYFLLCDMLINTLAWDRGQCLNHHHNL